MCLIFSILGTAVLPSELTKAVMNNVSRAMRKWRRKRIKEMRRVRWRRPVVEK